MKVKVKKWKQKRQVGRGYRSSGRQPGKGRERASFLFIYFPFIFISWRIITLQYCSGFCHTLTRISHGFTCVPHPDAPSRLPPHPIPLGLPSAPARSTCLWENSIETSILSRVKQTTSPGWMHETSAQEKSFLNTFYEKRWNQTLALPPKPSWPLIQ